MGKYAILINANTDDTHTGSCANGLEYALDFDDGGHEVELYFDGAATKWIRKLEGDSESPVKKYYDEIRERGLITGACRYCAGAYGVAEAVEEAGVPLLGGGNFDHGPDVAELADRGFEILTIG